MSADAPTAVDAVIVTYNSRDTIRACVTSLIGEERVDIVVVDSDSPEGGLDEVAGLPVRAIASGRNGGFGFGCNLGTRAGHAPYVLLLNPDARLGEGALDEMRAVLDADPRVAVVGPRLPDDEGRLMFSMRRRQRPSTTWARAVPASPPPRARWADEIDTRRDGGGARRERRVLGRSAPLAVD